MKTWGLLFLAFGVGVVVGAYGLPSGTIIFETNGDAVRVDRATGVKEFATAKGWMTEDAILRSVESEVRPEVARFDERMRTMIEAHKTGQLVSHQILGRQVKAYYRSGETGVYYAASPEDPRLVALEQALEPGPR